MYNHHRYSEVSKLVCLVLMRVSSMTLWEQILGFLQIFSYLLNKFLMESCIFFVQCGISSKICFFFNMYYRSTTIRTIFGILTRETRNVYICAGAYCFVTKSLSIFFALIWGKRCDICMNVFRWRIILSLGYPFLVEF